MTVSSYQNPVLSQQDNELFNSFLEKNKMFVLESKTKSGVFKQSFPLYFGTNEEEINPHRKMALLKKRNAALSISNNNNNTANNTSQLTKRKSVTIFDATTANAESNIKKIQTNSASTNSSSSETTTIDEPSSASSVSTNGKEPIIEKPQSEVKAAPTVKATTPEPTTPAVSPSVKPSSTLKPATVAAVKPQVAESPKLSFADMLRNNRAAKAQQASANGTASNSPHSNSPSGPGSINKPATKGTALANGVSGAKKSNYDTIPDSFKTSPANALPITLLRIMFDSKYINQMFTPDTQSSIHPHGLQNSGNICYMNSILQFLFYCNPFSEMLNIIRDNTFKDLDPKNSTTPILNALLDLQDSFRITTVASSPASPSSSPSPNSNNDLFTPLKCDIINPDKFYAQVGALPRFSHLIWGRQEDAEEFLNNLLDGLHEEFIQSIKSLPSTDVLEFANAFNNKELARKIIQNVDFINDSVKSGSPVSDNDSWNEVGSNMKTIGKRTFQVKLSPIVNLFGGQFKSVLKNANKKSSITLDPFMQLQLDISDAGTNDLSTAFEKFSQDEEVSLGSSTAKKQNFIDKLPSILIIHLKRFSFVTNDDHNSENNEFEVVNSKKGKKNNNNNNKQYQSYSQFNDQSSKFDGRIEKIHKFIKYDHNLTLPKSCISTMVNEEPNYKLLGVVYHHGRSTENGHYTADMLTSNNQWVRLDDTNITRISPDDAVSDQNEKTNINKTAYILMYQKI